MAENAVPSTQIPTFIRETTPEAKISSKVKAKPSVTPRTFKRFFTPRNSFQSISSTYPARDALGEITKSGLNSRKRPTSARTSHRCVDVNTTPPSASSQTFWEKTKSSPAFNHHDIDSSPLKRMRYTREETEELPDISDEEEIHFPEPVRRSRFRGGLGDYLRRELNLTVSSYQRPTFSVDSRLETSRFHTTPDAIHNCRDSISRGGGTTLPFCSATCNSKY
jgi:hypothetical protein